MRRSAPLSLGHAGGRGGGSTACFSMRRSVHLPHLRHASCTASSIGAGAGDGAYGRLPQNSHFSSTFSGNAAGAGPSLRLGGRGRSNQRFGGGASAAAASAAAKGRPPAHSAAQNWRHSIARQKVCSARFQLAGLPLRRQGRIGTGRAGAPSDCKFFGSAAAASLTAPGTRPCPTWGPGTASTPRPCPNCVRIPPWPQPGASGRPAGRLFVTQCTTRLVKACGGVCLCRRTLSLDPGTAVWRGPRLCGALLVSAALGSDANADRPPAAGRRLARKRGRNGIVGARAAPRHTEHAAWTTACAQAFRPDRNARLRRLACAAARSPDRVRRALDSPAGGLPRSARLRNARSAHRGRRAPGGAPPAVA